MRQIILTKGLPGCGKTTWCKQFMEQHPNQYKHITKDALREMLDFGVWNKHSEKLIVAARDTLILLALEHGYHVLVDDTNFEVKHEQHIRELVKGKAVVSMQDFTDVPLETCIKRDLQRTHSVGEAVIRRMYNQYLAPKPPLVAYNPLLPDAIICDLDGTLALLNGRNPYDASLCENDLLNIPVADIIRHIPASVLLVSGRQECHRPQTERWLQRHSIRYNALWMRPTGDTRRDNIIKQEIYDEHIRDKWNIKFVLDDRNQVVHFWRSIGLTCLQVAEGDF